MTALQIIISRFRLNKESFDQKVGEHDSEEERVDRFLTATKEIENPLKAKGYDVFMPDRFYRGVPESVLLVDRQAPFFLDEQYGQRVDKDFLECAVRANIPYELDERYIDLSRRRLAGACTRNL